MALAVPLRILVVDGWPEARSLIVRVFTEAGFEVSEAWTLQEAKSRITHGRPNILIADCAVSDNAEDFVHWVKERHPKVSIIAISDDPEQTSQEMHAADVVLGKPILLAELVQVILYFVDQIEAERLCNGFVN